MERARRREPPRLQIAIGHGRFQLIVTVPQDFRRRLGLNAGDRILVSIDEARGVLVVEPFDRPVGGSR